MLGRRFDIPRSTASAAAVLPRLVLIVNEVIRAGKEVDKAEYVATPRGGGYFCVRWVKPAPHMPKRVPTFVGMILASSLVAEPDRVTSDRWTRFSRFCQEKCERLIAWSSKGHFSSAQSRNEKMDMYGGSILVDGVTLGFSGLTEDGDEAAMLLLAIDMRWMGREEAFRIAALSGNDFFMALYATLHSEGFFDQE